MTVTRLGKFTIQLAAVAALVAVSAGVAGAQKAKPPTPRPGGPPVTTRGETKANEHAAKGQANAEAKRTEAREDKAERMAIKSARNEPKALLKGIRLSAAERTSVEGIEKKYAGQLKDLEKQEDAAEKSGKPDATFVSKIDALRTQERTELRAALTPAQATQFDKNAATLGTKH
jgi:hypothetical protein